MIINEKDIVILVDTIERVIGIKLEAGIKKELNDTLKRILINIDNCIYYEMLYLIEDCKEIKSIITKYNLLIGDDYDAKWLCEGKKKEIMYFLISYAELFGIKEKLLGKIEEDIRLIEKKENV